MDPDETTAGKGAPDDAAVEPSDVLTNFDTAAAHRRIFALLDKNKNGGLDITELSVLSEALGVEASQFQLEELVKQGSEMKATEFWEELLKHAALPKAEAAAAGFVISTADYDPLALGFFSIDSPARLALLRVVMRPVFDFVILACIAGNSVLMALDNPVKDGDNPTDFEKRLETFELIFNVIFTLEMLLKILALGFVRGELTYLQSPWNILDFVVVVTAWLPYLIGESANAGGIRAFRLLRPLRAITRFPGLKRLVTTLFMAIPQLQVLVIMVLFYVFVFAVTATQLWKGLFYQRCHTTNATYTDCVAAERMFCEQGGGLFADDGAAFCDPASTNKGLPWEGMACPAGDVCESHSENPYWGILSFDSFADSTIPVFQMATVSSWQEVMHITQDTAGAFAVIYFLLGTVVGGYFLLNLVIAVLKSKYEIASAVESESDDVFAEIDGDGSGALDPEELGELFALKGVRLTSDQVVEIFSKVDKDNDGTVDLNEFSAWLRSNDVLAAQMREYLNVGKSRATGADKARMEADDLPDDMPLQDRVKCKLKTFNPDDDWMPLFMYYDADRSGDIGLEEFTLILRRDIGIRPEVLTAEDIAAVFSDIDQGGEGDVDAQEFSQWVMSNESPAATLARMRHAIRKTTLTELEEIVKTKISTDGQVSDEAKAGGAESEGLKRIIKGAPFYYIVVATLCVNTFFLVLDYHGISDDNAQVLEWVNIGLSIIFLLEMLMKIVAFSSDGPLSDFSVFDKFDLFLCLGGLMDIIGGGQSESLRILSLVFRVWRIVRLAWVVKQLQPVFHVAVKTVSGLVYILSLQALFMFIFTIFGMQLFGGKFDFLETGRPRAHYDDFVAALISTFQITTFDSWQAIMYDGIRSNGGAAALYFISWVVVGSILLLNLLLVIILDVYVMVMGDEDDDTDEAEAADNDFDMGNPMAGPVISGDNSPSSPLETFETDEIQDMGDVEYTPLRQTAIKIASSPRTDHIIIVIIVANCVTMAMDHPRIDPDSEIRLLLDLVDFIFTIIFTVEMAMRVIAFGLLEEEDGYLRSWWNRLDFAIVIISWVDYFAQAANIGFLKTLRLLRALRALRLFNRLTGLKVLIDSLLDSIIALQYIFAIVGIVFVAFAILAVALFKGQLWRCQDDAGAVGRSTCMGTFVNPSGEVEAALWVNPKNNFDNVLTALFSLFTVSTTNDWIITANLAMDAVGIDQQPVPEHKRWPFIYFMLFIVAVPWFSLNLFIGVIYGKYVDRATAGLEELSKAQKQWLAIMNQLGFIEPQRHLKDLRADLDPLRKQIFDVVVHERFDQAIMGCILFNCIIMAGTYYAEPDWWTTTQDVLNLVFTLVFTVEAVMKMLAYGLRVYLMDSWCQFDLFVVIGSWLDLLFTWLGVSLFSSSMFRVVRVTRVIGRIGRMLKILSDSSSTLGLDEIFMCLYQTLPQLGYIGILVSLILFIFGVLAMNLFGLVIRNGCINDHANFETAGLGMLTLTGVATKDRVTCTIHALMVEEPYCSEELGNCGSPVIAPIFFVLFSLTIMFTTLEMFVNVVLQAFEDLTNAAGLPVTLADMRTFAGVWAHYDPLAEGWIWLSELEPLFKVLPPELGLDPLNGDKELDVTQLRLVELPGGQFSRHLVGDGMAEVKSLGTRECEELRIARIVQVCYGIPGHPEKGIDEGLEHTTDSLHDSLKAFGLSKREVAAVIWLLDSEDGSGGDEDGGDGTLSGLEFETGIKEFHAEMYGAKEEKQLDDEESKAMPLGEPATDDDGERQQEGHTAAVDETANSGDATSASDDEEVDDDTNESAVVDGGDDDKGGDAGGSVPLKRSRSNTDRQVAANKRLQERAELALRKLIQGRLNFTEVLFAVCERKVGKPLPPHNFICREARLNLGLRMPTLATWVRDLAYESQADELHT